MLQLRTSLTALAPGLLLVTGLTGLSYLLVRVPGLGVLGPLVLALLIGLAMRAAVGLPRAAAAGATFSAKTLLRIGIVLLGVRLEFGLLLQVGPAVLLGSLLVVTLGVFGIERLGRLAGLPRGLRLAIAVGTSICGASAILAAVPTARIGDEEAGASVGIISVLGTIGVLLFSLASSLLEPGEQLYGLLVGFTLHEVAQVLAAGYVQGTESGDLATIVKLTRVALLAPTLLILGSLLRTPRGAGEEAGRPRLPVPLFLIGFLLVGVLNSLGWIPATLGSWLEAGSLLFTTMAMVGLGLGIDLSVFRRVGTRALAVGAGGFAGLMALMLPYAILVSR